jgi:hypothetical protein
MPTLTLWLIALAASAGAALPRPAERRLAGWGLLAYALGAASVSVAASGDVRLTDLGTPSVAVDGGLQLLGALLLLAAGLRAWTLRPPTRVAAALVAGASVLLGWQARPVLAAGGVAADAAAALIGIGAAVVLALVVRGIAAVPPLRGLVSRAVVPANAVTRPAAALAVAGAAAAVLGPSAWIVIAGALCAAGAPAVGRRRVPVLALIAAAGLLPALWFMHTVAGPVGLRVATIGDVPFSPAAETLVAPILALGAFGFFGIWPLGRWGSTALVPVGVALIVRLGAGVPSGLEAWQTVLVPLGVLAVWHAALTADPDEAVASWAWLAAVSGGNLGAILLAAAAPALAAAPVVVRRAGARAGTWTRRAAWGVAGAGGVLALESLLRAQVVYAVLAAIALALMIAIPGRVPEAAR